MPEEIRSIPVTFANTGIVLRSSPDEIPITSYKALVNAVTDRENTVSVRRGFSRLNSGLSSPPYSFYYLKDIDGVAWRYAIAGGQLYICQATDSATFSAVTGGSGLKSTGDRRAHFTTYSLQGAYSYPHMFLADGEAFLRHPGGTTAPARRVGIPKPSQLTSVTVADNDITSIETFEAASDWTPSSECTVDTDTGGHTNNAVKFSVEGSGTYGYAYRIFKSGGNPTILDLGTEDLEEPIEIWYKIADVTTGAGLEEITVAFNLSNTAGDYSFSTRYEKAISISALQAAAQADASYTEVIQEIASDAGISRTAGILDESADEAGVTAKSSEVIRQFVTAAPTQLAPSVGVWNVLRIKKRDFVRVGVSEASDPTLGWDKVTAMRIALKTTSSNTGTCSVSFDDCALAKSGKLFGTDLQWTITYYDAVTGTESDYADPIQIQYPGVYLARVKLQFPQCPDNTPPFANPTHIKIYRMGGTVTSFRFVDMIQFTANQVPDPYYDEIPDDELGPEMETDNQLPPDDVKGVVLFDNRLWVWGGNYAGTADPPNRLRFSKATMVESFPTDNYLQIGTGGEIIQTCVEFDGELFVFTTSKIYRVIGSGGEYRVLDTAINYGVPGPFAVARAPRVVYLCSYDGIYEFPSGRKISEPINPIFFGETVNEITPVQSSKRSYCHLAFWDNKLYFTYRTTTDDNITNDRTLVWDAIYERWHYYLYGSQALFVEPETNYLVGGQIVQWDSVENGIPKDMSYSGNYPMRLESGYYDVVSTGPLGIFWAIDTKEYDLGMPDNEKRFIDMVVDADSADSEINVQVALDPTGAEQSSPYQTIGGIDTSGRQKTILQMPGSTGDSMLAHRLALRILGRASSSATQSARVYKVIHRVLLEPPWHRTHVTGWSDYGQVGPKYFRTLWADLNTDGTSLTKIEVYVDGSLAQTFQHDILSNIRKRYYFALDPDIYGSLAQLKIYSQNGRVKLYDHGFDFMTEPARLDTQQTPWSDEGWPYKKLWKEVVLDIDTGGQSVSVNFCLDGSIKKTFTVTTSTRSLVTISLDKDTIGKLGRVTIDMPEGDDKKQKLYSVRYVVDKEPPDVTFADSYGQLFSYDRLKVLRRLWIAMKNPASVNLKVYTDESLAYETNVSANQEASGFTKRRIDIPAGVKGKIFRIIMSSSSAFHMYWDRSEWELKDLNTEDGYRRERMIPPQTF